MRNKLFGILSLFFVLLLGYPDSREAKAQSTCGSTQCCLVCHDGYGCFKFDPTSHIGDHCCKEPVINKKDGAPVCRGKSKPFDANGVLITDSTTDPTWCCLAP